MAIVAGILDWRTRRIPNWLTVSGAVVGLVTNTALFGWFGMKDSLLGTLLGLALLLPFVLIRSLGAGDWKLAGALGGCIGPHQLLAVLLLTVLIEGLIAIAVVLYTGRLLQTLKNIAHIIASLFSLRLPGFEVSLDNPQSTKIPLGVAMAIAVVLCCTLRLAGKL